MSALPLGRIDALDCLDHCDCYEYFEYSHLASPNPCELLQRSARRWLRGSGCRNDLQGTAGPPWEDLLGAIESFDSFKTMFKVIQGACSVLKCIARLRGRTKGGAGQARAWPQTAQDRSGGHTWRVRCGSGRRCRPGCRLGGARQSGARRWVTVGLPAYFQSWGGPGPWRDAEVDRHPVRRDVRGGVSSPCRGRRSGSVAPFCDVHHRFRRSPVAGSPVPQHRIRDIDALAVEDPDPLQSQARAVRTAAIPVLRTTCSVAAARRRLARSFSAARRVRESSRDRPTRPRSRPKPGSPSVFGRHIGSLGAEHSRAIHPI